MIAPLKTNAHAAELWRLVDIMRDVLVYAAALKKGAAPDREDFVGSVGEGDRVFGALEKHGGVRPLVRALCPPR